MNPEGSSKEVLEKYKYFNVKERQPCTENYACFHYSDTSTLMIIRQKFCFDQKLLLQRMFAQKEIHENARGGHSLVSSVPMRDQKNDEKGYFFSRRAVRSADII